MSGPRLLRSARTFLTAPGILRFLNRRSRSRPPARDDLLENLEKRTAWDRFYLKSLAQPFKHFDWFLGYSSLHGILVELLLGVDKDGPRKLLDLGCGTSELGPRLYCDCPFPLHVYCVDFSPVAVSLMQAQFSPLPAPGNPASQLHFLQADATHLLDFQSGTFDLILDKGTMDAMLRANDGGLAVKQALSESVRVMHAGGSVLQVSDEDPDVRILWLERVWKVNVTAFELEPDGRTSYFAYLIKPIK
ncbi:citrate synthase-lysine N-methyltransferase CSKMT, mitochondrial [Carcharodon carcharias]|uniref:citrate synthase-lysine N-methyltransferase CSKMT, mitochondrial n=1 Tax=Carcharodon carcharias TaxID=13397 RepID=UPI001B7F71CA|nr:citrate synthase-lysine N-methyltransferase CSKMT, mitochondrial [Carcharodon carcharias]